MSIPLDPLADMEQSLMMAQQSQSVMQQSIVQSVIHQGEQPTALEAPPMQSMFMQTVYGIQQPSWVNEEEFRPKTAEPRGSFRKDLK